MTTNKTTAKHTPTPWTCRRARSGKDRWHVEGPTMDPDKQGYVAELDSRGVQNEANAAFIVRAVNAHDDLLAALKAVDSDLASRGWPTNHDVRMLARAAIAKATTGC